MPRPSGTITSPARARSGTRPGDVRAVVAHAPGGGADQAGDRLQRRGLAGAVGADQADQLALRRPRGRCPSRRGCRRSGPPGPSPQAGSTAVDRRAEVGLDHLRIVLHFGRARPRRSARRSRAPATRSQTFITRRTSCSMSSIVTPSSRIVCEQPAPARASPSRSCRRPARRARAASARWRARARSRGGAGRRRAGCRRRRWRARDADVVEQLGGPLLDRRLLGERARVAQHRADHAGARAHVAADHHVLERRQVGEQADVLERARDAARGDFVRLAARRAAGRRSENALRPGRRCRSAR